ncbi:metallophosphoesterase [Candidatus Sumerlaeota bacterium]|nr:metallophosphoesterase [Candidatus Sumerlaeota bacterium]
MNQTAKLDRGSRGHGGRPRVRRILAATCAVAILAFFAAEALALWLHRTEGSAPLPAALGNFPRIRETLTSQPDREEFSFAVVGDTRGGSTFERIAERLRDEPLSFCVNLGDFVNRPSEAQHAFFRAEVAEELAFPFPLFLIAGNHDVDEKHFSLSRFEQLYGPTIFSFPYQDCLFVFLRVLPDGQSNRESLDFLRGLADSDARRRYRHIFVFTHVPPPISRDFETKECDGSDEFVSLIDRLNPDYVICGDYHGYARIERRDTAYLVTGGGGAPLRDANFGHFHHAIVIHVDPDSVSERILYVDEEHESEDRLEKYMLVGLLPWLDRYRAAAFALNLLLLVALASCVRVTVFPGHPAAPKNKLDPA